MHSQNSRYKLPVTIVAIFVLSVVVGGLLAPLLFNVLLWLGRNVEAFAGLRQLPFEKVTSRCVLLSVLGGAFVMMRCAGLTTAGKQGFRRGARWKGAVGRGFLMGGVTMALLLAAAWLTDAYVLRAGGMTGKLWLKTVGNLVGAMLIGYIEEWLFRGVIFGSLRKAMGVIAAALISSAFFSAVHFARPENPVGVVYGHWYSAFQLMPHLFSSGDFYWGHEGYKAFTLFFMGLTLCLFYAWRGDLYFIIGLHAGWVWVMRIGDYIFDDRNREVLPRLFGPTPGIAKSGLALLMSALFAGVALGMYLWGRRRTASAGEAG
jgi:membrane protease YdiL (CAAX protease family)